MKRYTILYLLTFVLAFVACTNEDQPSPVLPEKAQVTIDLQMPGLNLPTKSAATDVENQISDLYVLMFGADGFQTYAKASSVTDANTSAEKKVMVNLPFAEAEVDLVFLANIGQEGKDFLDRISIGAAKDDALSSMVFDCPESADVPLIPMWGETTVAGISSSTSISAVMIRSMVVVKLSITSDVLNFTLREVSFHNASSVGKIAPDARVWNGTNKVTGPSIPADAGSNTLYAETTTTATFYVPETSEAGTGATNAYLIIKGDYQDFGECYYRLDMLNKEGAPVSLLRNHVYTFTISGIRAIGYTSSSEAAAYPAANAVQGDLPPTITITDKATDMNEATTDGKNYLAVNASKFNLPASGSRAVRLKVYTDVPGGWKLIDLPAGVSASPSEGAANTVGSTWVWVDEGVSSGVQFYVKAGTLWKIITIN